MIAEWMGEGPAAWQHMAVFVLVQDLGFKCWV